MNNDMKKMLVLITTSFPYGKLEPFIVIGNKKRGLSRFESLLGSFGLESRLISSTNDFTEEQLLPIDYDKVFEIIKFKRQESFDFLEKMLSR